MLEDGVASADVAIWVINNARLGVVCASNGSIASGELAPIGGVRADNGGLDTSGGGIASCHIVTNVGGSAGYVGVRAGRLEGDLRGVANIVGASIRVIAEVSNSVVALHFSNTSIQSADVGIVTDPSSGSATNASIANGGGAEISRIKPGAIDGGVGAVVETVGVHTSISSAFVEIVTVRSVEELARSVEALEGLARSASGAGNDGVLASGDAADDGARISSASIAIITVLW